MSYKTHHPQIVGVALTLISLLLNSHIAHATVLAPGGAIALTGTTFAAEPELGGLVIVDELVPYQIFGSGVGNPLLYEGDLQARIVRSFLTDNLIFNYRLRGPTSGLNGIVSTLVTSDFAGWDTDVEYRTDGLGDKEPTRATRSADGSDVTFIFGNSLFSSEESLFMHILTNAKAFTTGQTTLTLTDGSNVVLSTYQPAVPEPSTITLATLSLLGMGWRRRNRT